MRYITIASITTLVVAALGCGGTDKRARSPEETQALSRFPALAFAPDEPSYVLVSPRATDLVTGAREATAALGLLAGFDLAEIDGLMARELGFSPWSPEQLADAGVAMDGSAVVFATGFMPTFVVTVADPERLAAFLAEHRPSGKLSVRRYQDHDWFSFEFANEVAVQWIAWDEHLAVRLALGDDIQGTAWLDDLFSGPERSGRGPVLEALGRGSALVQNTDIGGMIDIEAVFEAVLEIAPERERKSLASCLRVFDVVSGSVAVSADIEWSSASGALAIGLSPEAAAALRQHLLPVAPGFAALRADAEVYGSMNVDLGWLDSERAALGCPLLEERLRFPGGIGPDVYEAFSGVYGAILRADLSGRALRALVGIGLRDKALGNQLLNLIPQRRLLARRSKIAGQSVEIVSLPMLPTLAYRHDDTGLLMAVGDGVMAKALTADTAAAQDVALDVASLGIRPSRMAQLEEILITIARQTGYSADFARESYRRLSRYEHGSVDITLEGDALVVRLSMGLAR